MQFKVANVICRFNSASGGPPRTVVSIAKAGVGRWMAELFTTDYIASEADELLLSEFPGHVNVLGESAQTYWGGTMMAIGLSRKFHSQLRGDARPDVIHLHGLWSPYLVAYAGAAMRHGIPYIVAPHGMLEPWSLTRRGGRKRLALKTYQGRILSNAAAIHATSDMEAEHVRQLGYSQSPIFVVPNAVDEPQQVTPVVPAKSGDRRTLLFLSRIHEKKGLDVLLRAWKEVRPEAWKLAIVGSGAERYISHLMRYCTNNGVQNVEFHSHVNGAEREAAFHEASAFVLPTYSENFGNAVAEALIRGIPVITTTGTPWSVVAEQGFGWYIEPKLNQLKQALIELMAAEPARLLEMGLRGQRYAREALIIDAVGARLFEMYQSVLRRR
jgi:glycosyltransferase involved in cell wall biosynthesis